MIFFFIFSLIFNSFLFTSANASDKQNKVCFQDKCFSVELAMTPEARTQGLMFRNELGPQEGMLFIFPTEEIYPFWMKNTYIALDIIWLNKSKEVVFVKEGAQPCSEESCPVIHPDQKALYVLEVIAGTVRNAGLKVGDSFSF